MRHYLLSMSVALFLLGTAFGQEPYRTGLLYEDPSLRPFLNKVTTVEPIPGKAPALAPPSYDLSSQMPPVRSQGGQGSCVAWAAGYYHRTHVEWLERGWDVADPDHQFSPAFIYNLINGGVDLGSYFSDAFKCICDLGVTPYSVMPYSSSDYLTWPSEEAFDTGIDYRALQTNYISISSDTGIGNLKQHVANGQTAVIGIYVWDNFYSISSYGYYYCVADKTGSNHGGHGVTVVGYDDSRSTNDGPGAFKIVNSWGSGWGDSGYFWMSYAAIKDSSLCQGWAYYLTDLVGYKARIKLRALVDHPTRDRVSIEAGIGPSASPLWSKSFFNWIRGAQADWPFPSNRIVLDLTDGLPHYVSHVENEAYFRCRDETADAQSGEIVYLHGEDCGWAKKGSDSYETPVTIPDGGSEVAAVAFVPLLCPHTLRVSQSTEGGEPSLDSAMATVSANGRYIAFASDASDIVVGDGNAATDVFVRDLMTGVTERVSVSSAGAEGNAASYSPDVSADGRYIVFASDATNLVSGDSNGATDVFLRDREVGTTTRVSVDSAEWQCSGASYDPQVSDDGGCVVFCSDASDLVSGDGNGVSDVFIRDVVAGETVRLSISTGDTEGNGGSAAPAISGDGRYTAFQSSASNLVTGDSNGVDDIFVRDFVGDSTVRASVNSDGDECDVGSSSPSISSEPDLRVAFECPDCNLVPGDTNGFSDVFVRDLVTMETQCVSRAYDGSSANGVSFAPSISYNGRFVAFESWATDLVAGDTVMFDKVFVRDITRDLTRIVSRTYDNLDPNGDSGSPSISSYGRTVAFVGGASNLVPNDLNSRADVFIRGGLETWSLNGVVIKDSLGQTVAVVNEQGDLALKRTLTAQTIPAPIEGIAELVIRLPSGDPLAVFDQSGNLKICGRCFPEWPYVLWPPAHSFEIRSSTGRYVGCLDSGGNLYLEGALYENSLP